MAKGFIDRKLEQYLDILEKIVQAKSNIVINQNTLKIYCNKATKLKKYVNEKIAKLD